MKKTLILLAVICLLMATFSGCNTPPSNVENSSPPASSETISTDNPIDGAFLHMTTALTPSELESETFAYVYAKQWYDELEHLFKTVNGNRYFYFSFDYRSYIAQQVEITLLASGEEQNASNELRALGDFFRSETLRFQNMIESEGKEYEFLQDKETIISELESYDYTLSTSMEWSRESPLLPLVAVPEKNVYLYFPHPFGQMLSIEGNSTLLLDWPPLSPRGGGLRPTMTVSDIDEDGADEIIVVHTPFTGWGITYISADELYIVKYDNNSGAVEKTTKLTLEDLVERIAPDVHLVYDSNSISLHYQGQVVNIPLPKRDTATDEYIVDIGNLVRYSVDGKQITVDIGIVIQNKNALQATAVVDLTADIKYVSTNTDSPDFMIENAVISYTEE